MSQSVSHSGRHPLPASPIKGEVGFRSWRTMVACTPGLATAITEEVPLHSWARIVPRPAKGASASSPLPLGERSAAGRVRGPPHTVPGKGPLTRPKRVGLSPRGRGEESTERAS